MHDAAGEVVAGQRRLVVLGALDDVGGHDAGRRRSAARRRRRRRTRRGPGRAARAPPRGRAIRSAVIRRGMGSTRNAPSGSSPKLMPRSSAAWATSRPRSPRSRPSSASAARGSAPGESPGARRPRRRTRHRRSSGSPRYRCTDAARFPDPRRWQAAVRRRPSPRTSKPASSRRRTRLAGPPRPGATSCGAARRRRSWRPRTRAAGRSRSVRGRRWRPRGSRAWPAPSHCRSCAACGDEHRHDRGQDDAHAGVDRVAVAGRARRGSGRAR